MRAYSMRKAYLVTTVMFISFISGYLLFAFQYSSEQHCKDPNISVPEAHLDGDCQCKYILKDASEKKAHYCSEYSTSRGPNQKVISFSFYGGFKGGYFEGIKYNVEGVKKYYPGYIMRLYHDIETPYMNEEDGGKALCELYCKEDILDLCNARYIDSYNNLQTYFGMLWRFAPMADPLVLEWHSRDLDSRISEREISAVNEWKASGKSYHLMRDHPAHVSEIVGCCFGMKKTIENSLVMRNDFENMLLRSEKVWNRGLDQKLLIKIVWPHARHDMVAHDSYLCRVYYSSNNKPWPTKRLEGKWNFVGSNGGEISSKGHRECPRTCRPKDHQDWSFC